MERRDVAEDRLNDVPCRFDNVLAHEEVGVAVQGIAEQSLVRAT